jgi:hypothetical protein
MKARLVPVYFKSGTDLEFTTQVDTLRNILAEEAEILALVALGSTLPDAEAIIFPQLLREAYKQRSDFKQINLPLLTVTSEFGTVSMWDWKIAALLRSEGMTVLAPYNLEQTRKICQGLA